MKRRTSKKKFGKKCKEVHRGIRKMRNQPLGEIIKELNQMLVGYYHYYGITHNSERIKAFSHEVRKNLFFRLNRRIQKRSYNWNNFNAVLEKYPLARPKIYVSIYS